MSLPGIFVLDRAIAEVPTDSHPVQVQTTQFGIRPVMDYRMMSSDTMRPADVGPAVRKPALLETLEKITAVSDGSMDPLT